MRLALLATAVATALAAGCVEGESKFFPDESALVERVHVNAYAADVDGKGPREARVEVSGIGADINEHAFTGKLHITLELQDNTRPEHTYSKVKEWTFDVKAEDFASATVPYYLFVIPASDLSPGKTFRAHANAEIEGRSVPGDAALFYWAP